MAVPVLTTVALSLIQVNTATSGGGTITSASTVTVKGVCWNTTGTPTTADSKTSNGTGLTAFESKLTGLVELTTYYVRAYATNSDGTGYGSELTFTTLSDALLKSMSIGWNKVQDPSPLPILPALKSISLRWQTYTGIPFINNFYCDTSSISSIYKPYFGVGDEIYFYCGVDGVPTSYLWDFGDGTTSTDKDPIHIYTLPATYTVSLTATNSYGSDTMTKVNYMVIVNSYPSLKSISIQFGRPTYQIQNFPAVKSLSIRWDRPDTGGYTNSTNDSFFQFGG